MMIESCKRHMIDFMRSKCNDSDFVKKIATSKKTNTGERSLMKLQCKAAFILSFDKIAFTSWLGNVLVA